MKRVAVLVPESGAHEVINFAAKIREEERSKGDGPTTGAPGHDAKLISRLAKDVFGGYREMFVHHDWPERGSDMMRKVQSRAAETYGSVEGFGKHFENHKNE